MALEAIDSDVIKTYVRLGLGVGIVAEMAVRDEPRRRRPGLRARLGHLFGSNVARVAFKRGAYLRHFVYAFAELLSDRLTPRADPARDERRRRRLPALTATPMP